MTGHGLRRGASIGVRASDEALRERLDREITGLEPAIVRLADKYHFPLDPPIDLEAVHNVNPYHGDRAAATAGRTLFNVHCSHCHSPNAQSPDPMRDLRRLHLRYGDRVDDVFWTTVTQGRPTKGMPVWGPILSEDTIWRIKTFLDTVQKRDLD